MEKTLKGIKIKGHIVFKNKKEYSDCIEEIPENTEVLIKISDSRSLEKNACLHGWISIIASELGEDFDYMKIFLVCKHFGCTERLLEDGTVIKIPVSTSKLSNKDFGEGLNRLYIWALEELNITLPNKDTITKHLK